MVRRAGRFLSSIFTMLLVSAGLTVSAAVAGHAAPRPAPKPTAITITGDGLAKPIDLRVETDPALFAAVLDQVSFLNGAGHAAPNRATLGRKFTLVVLVGGVAKQTYDLYPLAKGGPRAFRPAKQPDLRKTTSAWFLGRLNMSETLRTAGVPLPAQPDALSGGIGGGERVIPDDLEASKDVDRLLGDLRQVLLLNAGVVIAITLGLAGIALLVRRRTR
ncbi:MAG TPA: hypothetical protein VGD43_02860 [Micromonospora sp.]